MPGRIPEVAPAANRISRGWWIAQERRKAGSGSGFFGTGASDQNRNGRNTLVDCPLQTCKRLRSRANAAHTRVTASRICANAANCIANVSAAVQFTLTSLQTIVAFAQSIPSPAPTPRPNRRRNWRIRNWRVILVHSPAAASGFELEATLLRECT
jgi:hypothetical protein